MASTRLPHFPTATSITAISSRGLDTIASLDGLRALAILVVMWEHSGLIRLTPHIDRIMRPAYLGVDVFFVLSGFLITRILLHDRARDVPLRFFLMRRFLRIFPIYYLTLAVVAVWRPGPDVGWSALYLSNFYFAFNTDPSPLRHTWSLAVEEHFYLFWPLLVYSLKPQWSRNLAWLLPFLGVGCATALLCVAPETWPTGALIYRGTMFRITSLALGALIAFYEPQLRAHTRRLRGLGLVTFCGGALAISVVLPLLFLVLRLSHNWKSLAHMVGFALLATGILLITLSLSSAPTAATNPTVKPTVASTGRSHFFAGLLLIIALGVWAYNTFTSASIWPRFSSQTLTTLLQSGLLCAALIYCGLSFSGWANGAKVLLESSPLRFIGRISYGLYLYHVPVFIMWGLDSKSGILAPWFSLVGAFVTTWLVALASFRWIETPILRFKDRFRQG
ncbi:MAG TPA: acyltransferase [Abditibacterium sp.]|jgi:peptidoglycan/LPS O-acetylase OafA/YrhL